MSGLTLNRALPVEIRWMTDRVCIGALLMVSLHRDRSGELMAGLRS
jgi:hypothetical protein